MLSDLLVSELYESGEDIVKQGEKGSTMYILEDGECRAFNKCGKKNLNSGLGLELVCGWPSGWARRQGPSRLDLHSIGPELFQSEPGSKCVNGANGEVAVKHYRQQGEYFGEIALLKECERKATVRACGTGCSVLKLNKVDFDRVIGPIVDTLLGLLDAYPQYAAFFEDEN
eukprot:g6991.t1